MILVTDAGPITSQLSIDDLIIGGRHEEAEQKWEALKQQCSGRSIIVIHKQQIRMRVEFYLLHHADKVERGVEAVKQSLSDFMRRAKIS